MGWISSLNEMVGAIGPWLTIVILLIAFFIGMIISVILMIKSLSDSVTRLADKVSAPYQGVEEALIIFRSVMRDQIWQKLEYLGDVLEHNHIAERREQIEKNIERKFKGITKMEAEKLNKFKTKCGDMGKILLKEINWPKFLSPIYGIFFGTDSISKKIDDIHGIMNELVDKIATIIEDNGIHN